MTRKTKIIAGIFCAFLLLTGAAFQFGGIRFDLLSVTSSSSTVVLTKGHRQVNVASGSNNQVYNLPDATTLQAGYWYHFLNESSGTLTINNSSSTIITSLAQNQSAFLWVKSSATSGGPWSYSKAIASSSGGGGTVYSWSGYHNGVSANTCTWARANTAMGDPAVDPTCDLTPVDNTNFGTVTSYLSGSDKLPGITFSPPVAGLYFIRAGVNTVTDGSSITIEVQMWDGTTVIDDQNYVIAGSIGRRPMNLMGIYYANDTSSRSIRLRWRSSANTVTVEGVNSQQAINWQIYKIN